MGAVARAARAGGGRTVGVIPEALLALEVADQDADELVVTADMRERKGEMDARCRRVPRAARRASARSRSCSRSGWRASLGMHDKPIVVLDPDGVCAPLRAQVERLVDARLRPRRRGGRR